MYMKYVLLAVLVGGCTANPPTPLMQTASTPTTTSVYDFSAKTLDGAEVNLAQYKGKVLVIVNVASECGYTPQYADLQAFYQEYAAKGVEVLGFPSNDFGGQEPGSHADIKAFCTKNYGVTFPMFEKVVVKGSQAHPLYAYLQQATGAEVRWNFHKFLIDRSGKPVSAFASGAKPSEEAFMTALKPLL